MHKKIKIKFDYQNLFAEGGIVDDYQADFIFKE